MVKRILGIAIAAIVTLSLAACGGNPNGETGGKTDTPAAFSVGYAKADISPKESVPMGGYSDSDTRWSQNTELPLELICVAMTDEEGETVLFFAADLLMAYDYVADDLRNAVSSATGVPKDHIIYHVTHNHYGPETQLRGTTAIDLFVKNQTEEGVRIAQEALADRAAAKMETGFARLEGVNFVRHYLLKDGSLLGEGVGTVKQDVVGHAYAPDNLLQVVKFTREGSKDVVLVNWQGHLMADGAGYNSANACSPGIMRQELETTGNCLPIFILGGSGNMNNYSQINGENQFESYIEHGKFLAKQVMELTYQGAETGKIFLEESVLSLSNRGAMHDVPLYAFSIGDVAFATAPAEIFSKNAQAVRDTSKYPMTIYASCANGYNGYLPTPDAFPYYAYEVRITKYPQGTAETLQEEHTRMLDKLFTDAGYTEKEKAEGYVTQAFEPVSDGVEYVRVSTEATAVENGFYAFQMYAGMEVKNMLAIDEATARKALSRETGKLLFNEQNVIVDIVE